jgi:acyl-CoA reductase-like NAD-dependent aldehyde dehydrogenase
MPRRIDPNEVSAIIARVRAQVAGAAAGVAPAAPPTVAAARPAASGATRDGGDRPGVFARVDEAVAAAAEAFEAYSAAGLGLRKTIIAAMRAAMRERAGELAALAHAETGLGRAEDKVLKNLLVTEKTPGPEELEPEVVTGDHGMNVTEFAPYGIIASITPTTNPTSTIINNSIAILSAGNAVVFNAHPNAKGVSATNVAMLNRAIVAAGGPPNLITAIAEPTVETAREVMRHPRVRLLLVTGGPGVVKEALQTTKKAITAGPGNPPVVVDDTADLALASREIVRGASFDNNVICTDEKEVFVVARVADELLRGMERNGALVLQEHQLRKLERVIFETMGEPGKPGVINRKWIGKNASVIAAEIGITAGPELRLLVADVPVDHPLVWTEQMMPVLPVARVRDVEQAIDLAIKAEHRFGHTASIFSRNLDTITRYARRINVSIFTANGPNLSGLGYQSEGFTSFSIASPTGEGLTRPRTFSRMRRLTVVGALRIV